jgi:CheY-like chemotaxis protein
MFAKARSSAESTSFAKRVLVVDPDQKRWELLTRLLIAQGHVVHRINHIKEGPPRWPQHLYDLVILATDEPESAEFVDLCDKLTKLARPVAVAFLTGAAVTSNLSGVAHLSRNRSPAEIADEIARLLG